MIKKLTSNEQKGSKVNETKIDNSTLICSREIAEAFNVHLLT